ncbi:MAG: N-acetylglucosamine kinase [Anaerolineae bacterium]
MYSVRCVMGVDGGTTKTIALVADEHGCILGAARGAGSNWTGADVEIPMRVVAETTQEALGRAGVQPGQVEMAMFSLAGADWPEDHERRHIYLEACGLAQRLVVKNDAFGGLRAGTRHPYGIVIAAGTGINAAAIAPDGREWAFGYYADVGGAGDLAQEAVWAVIRADDGRGQPTALTRMVLDRLGLPTPEMLLRALVAGEIERGKIHSLCPLVFEAAEAGDEVASGILVRQGKALGDYATALVRRYEMQDLAFDVVLAGSVFKGRGPLLIDTVATVVREVAPKARIARAAFEPAAGAVLLAYDALGLSVTEAMYARLAETVPDARFFDTADGGQVRSRLRRT